MFKIFNVKLKIKEIFFTGHTVVDPSRLKLRKYVHVREETPHTLGDLSITCLTHVCFFSLSILFSSICRLISHVFLPQKSVYGIVDNR